MAAVTGNKLLSVRGLSRHFGGLKAVQDVDFDLAEGEIRAVIGPNGAGKTTFVSLICGRIEPSAGTIIFDGADITAMPAHRRVLAGIAVTSLSAVSSNTERAPLPVPANTMPLAPLVIAARIIDASGSTYE